MELPISFLKLPQELVSLLVNDWLKWTDVARLDSAICNTEYRSEWLDMLKTNCVAQSVSIGFDQLKSAPQHRWFVIRNVRARHVMFVERNSNDDAATIRWLEHTKQSIDKISLSFYNCEINDTHWNYVTSHFEFDGASHRRLFKRSQNYHRNRLIVSILDETIDKMGLVWRRRCLVIYSSTTYAAKSAVDPLQSFRFQFLLFKGACPNYIHLDLEDISFGDGFTQLMHSHKKGLRCFILPSCLLLTTADLASIVEFHAQSLRCMSIPNRTASGQYEGVVDLLNNLPLLNTVVTSFRALSNLASPVVNPSITHLYIEMDRCSLCFLRMPFQNHFPSLTELSISTTYTYDASELVMLLASRPSIKRVHVIGEVVTELQKLMPNITVGNYKRFDMYDTDY